MEKCLKSGGVKGVLCADGHKGYAQPVGGVIAYKDRISISGVGFDIACGNKAVKLDIKGSDIEPEQWTKIADDLAANLSFGVGRPNKDVAEHELFEDDPAWDIKEVGALKQLAKNQLGSIGSGNHYSDVFVDENDNVWVGVHFGSRGLGHKIATHFLDIAGGKDGMDVPPCIVDTDSTIGKEYIAAMKLAGRYAYAGRDWVVDKIAKILGGKILDEIHNHHNFAWEEEHNGENLWVVRKGSTPAFPGQRGFVGGSMGGRSVILHGVDSPPAKLALYSTVHGAGRVMSRTEAAGKVKWQKDENGKKRPVRVSEGKFNEKEMRKSISVLGIELRGGGADEAPAVYRNLEDVLESHKNSIKIETWLTPKIVVMAGADTFDPYKD